MSTGFNFGHLKKYTKFVSDTDQYIFCNADHTFATSGLTFQLSVVNQDNVSITNECVYTSSDKAIATVSSTGLVTSVSSGTCKIYINFDRAGQIDGDITVS